MVDLVSGDPRRAGQRDPRHRRRLDGQSDEILRLEVVDMRLAARAGDRLSLERQHTQVVGHALGPDRRIKSRCQVRILG